MPFFNKSNVPNLGAPKGFRPFIEVKPFGQWKETLKMIGKLDPAIKLASVKAQLKVCNVIKTKVKSHIRLNDLGWTKLSTKYAARKERVGLDSRILIASGAYYWGIQVWHIPTRNLVMVGVKKGLKSTAFGKRSKLDVAQIAAIHEFSNGKRLPRRPLWNPTIEEMGGKKGIQKMYINSLIHWLQQSGIKLSNTTLRIKDIPGDFE